MDSHYINFKKSYRTPSINLFSLIPRNPILEKSQ